MEEQVQSDLNLSVPLKQSNKSLVVVVALFFVLMAGGLVYLGYQNYRLQQRLSSLLEQQQSQIQQAPSPVPTFPPSFAEFMGWKPLIGGFVVNLPPTWSASSFDGGPFSEIRIYASNVSWEEAHENVEQLGVLTIKIGLTGEKLSTSTTFAWTTIGNEVMSNKLILQSDKGPITFQISYPVNSGYAQEIKDIIERLNLKPSQVELKDAKIVP